VIRKAAAMSMLMQTVTYSGWLSLPLWLKKTVGYEHGDQGRVWSQVQDAWLSTIRSKSSLRKQPVSPFRFSAPVGDEALAKDVSRVYAYL
jgi:hypothetical protein